MKSRVYKVRNRLFRYDYDECVVEQISKADPEMYEDNKEWQAKHGRNLWDIDEDGYMVMHSVGLMLENWKDKESRNEYLEMWADELNEEESWMVSDFIKYELPLYQKA